MTALLIACGLLLAWRLWKRHRAAVLVAVATIAALWLAANSETAKAGATVAAFIGAAGLVFWLCSGRSSSHAHTHGPATAHRDATPGTSANNTSERRRATTHELFHFEGAIEMGYSPEGAWVGDNGRGGTTCDVADGRDRAIYAAIGHVGEALIHDWSPKGHLRGVDLKDVKKHARMAGMTVEQVENEALKSAKRIRGRVRRRSPRLMRDGRI